MVKAPTAIVDDLNSIPGIHMMGEEGGGSLTYTVIHTYSHTHIQPFTHTHTSHKDKQK